MTHIGYFVRFKGHACSSISGVLSRKPILLRARMGEALFQVEIPVFLDSERPNKPNQASDWDRLARLECARAIARTNALRRKLSGDHMLRGADVVERLIRDHKQTRRGKRWKICPLYSVTSASDKPF